MQATLTIPYFFSLSAGKPEVLLRVSYVVLIINVPIMVLLIYYFNIKGAALSFVVSSILAYSFGVPRICKECLKIPVRDWYLHILKIFILAGVTYGMAWIFIIFFGKFTFLYLLLTYIVASILFITVAYFLIGYELRKTILRYISSL